jgi:hypothetical protein
MQRFAEACAICPHVRLTFSSREISQVLSEIVFEAAEMADAIIPATLPPGLKDEVLIAVSDCPPT